MGEGPAGSAGEEDQGPHVTSPVTLPHTCAPPSSTRGDPRALPHLTDGQAEGKQSSSPKDLPSWGPSPVLTASSRQLTPLPRSKTQPPCEASLPPMLPFRPAGAPPCHCAPIVPSVLPSSSPRAVRALPTHLRARAASATATCAAPESPPKRRHRLYKTDTSLFCIREKETKQCF